MNIEYAASGNSGFDTSCAWPCASFGDACSWGPSWGGCEGDYVYYTPKYSDSTTTVLAACSMTYRLYGYGADRWLFRLYLDDDTSSASTYSNEHTYWVDSADGNGAGARGSPGMMFAELSGFTGSSIRARIQVYDWNSDDSSSVMSTGCVFIEKMA